MSADAKKKVKKAQPKADEEPKKRGRRSMFTEDQKQILLKYYDDGMTSTNRQHMEMIEKCASESQTTVDRIKRFIGAENYKRRKTQGDDTDATPKPRKRKSDSSTTSKKKKGKGTEESEEEEEEE